MDHFNFDNFFHNEKTRKIQNKERYMALIKSHNYDYVLFLFHPFFPFSKKKRVTGMPIIKKRRKKEYPLGLFKIISIKKELK